MDAVSDLPLVSIVTPSLNQKEYLPAAVESVLRQDYPRLEYIVVDGGSTDGSVEVLRGYDGRLRWISEPDTGQANAINKGFRLSSGEILAWINADDLLLKGAVRKAVDAFRQEPDAGMVYGEGFLIDEEGRIKGRFPHSAPFNLWRLIHYGDTILQQTAFMRRSALEAVGRLDESLHWGLDWDLFIRLGKRYRARYIPEDLACLREYGTTKTSTGGYRRLRELGDVIRRHAGRRWTPSWAGYAQDFLYSQLAESARKGLPPGLGAAAAWMIRGLVRLVQPTVWRYMEESQGWYPDHGAAPHARFLLPNLRRPASLVIEGRLPPFVPEPLQQSLTVVVNGRELARVDLPEGSFRVVEPAPEWANGEVLLVDLLASRCISRRFYPSWARTRKISYFLERVEITPGEPAAV